MSLPISYYECLHLKAAGQFVITSKLVGTLSRCARTMHVTCDLEISDIILFTHLSGTSRGGAVGLSDHWVADTEHLWRSSADVGISPGRMHKQLHGLPHYDRMRGRMLSSCIEIVDIDTAPTLVTAHHALFLQ